MYILMHDYMNHDDDVDVDVIVGSMRRRPSDDTTSDYTSGMSANENERKRRLQPAPPVSRYTVG